jgi:hypothetical protein
MSERLPRSKPNAAPASAEDRGDVLTLFKQTMQELQEAENEEKISDAEIPTLLGRVVEKLQAEAGNRSEADKEKYVLEREWEMFESILDRIQSSTGDRGSFEALEKVKGVKTPEGDSDRPYFDTRTQTVHMGSEAMKTLNDPRSLIILLAAKGSIGAANELHHEFIHSCQVDANRSAKFLDRLRFFKGQNVLLKEVQALIGADRKGNGRRVDIGALLDTLQSDSYGLIATQEDAARAEVAASEIKQLYALGLSDEAIGNLVSKAKWDTTTKTYDTLASEIQKAAVNLTEDDLSGLVKVDELKTKLRIQKARIAAKEAITSFLKA